MNIHVLASADVISYYFFYPLLAHQKRLRELNVNLSFSDGIPRRLPRFDALLVDNRLFSPLWAQQREKVFEILKRLRAECQRLIWCDVTDSSGATQFQVLPLVDRYLKKQLLKDRTLYKNDFYGARIYTDYYRRQYALPDTGAFRVEPIREDQTPKLAVSWNLGLGPCFADLRLNNLWRRVPYAWRRNFPWAYGAKFENNRQRPVDIGFRGSDRYSNLAIAYQRLEIIKRLRARQVDTAVVPRQRYWQELSQTKICVSPFGAGEICFRDFEIIFQGGMLLKPEMSHLETWPDIFVKGQTYEAFRWDFSDFETQVETLLKDPARIEAVSRRAQQCYGKYFTPAGAEEFCRRFVQLVT